MTSLSTGVSTPITKLSIVVIILLCPHVLSAKYSSKYSDKNLNQQINKFILDIDNNARDEESLPNGLKNDGNKDINFTDYLNNNDRFKQNNNNNKPSTLALISECVQQRGIEDCLKIFLIRRIDRIKQLISEKANVSINFNNIQAEVQKNFDWQRYKNIDGKNLEKLVLKQLQGFVGNERIKLVLRPGIDLEFDKLKDGSMQMNIRKDKDLVTGRGNKASKMFYQIVPILLIPPLILSAILPFVLPAMKMMIVASMILNQLAFGGAIFTLLRNGIFDDKYEKKVIYVNQGYKNEHNAPPIIHHESFNHPSDSHVSHEDIFNTKDSYYSSSENKHYDFPRTVTGEGKVDSDNINLPQSFESRNKYKRVPYKNKIIEFNDQVSAKQRDPTIDSESNYFKRRISS